MLSACISGFNHLDWAKGKKFYVMLIKIGFEAWWKTEYRPIDRIALAYYCLKVLHLWYVWMN